VDDLRLNRRKSESLFNEKGVCLYQIVFTRTYADGHAVDVAR
jgi:hypothetical protein